MQSMIENLLESPEASIRYQAQLYLLDADPASEEMRHLQDDIRRSPRVQTLLSERSADGTIPHRAYTKWIGTHWVLATLADLHYPPGDISLQPLVEQEIEMILNISEITIAGKNRNCASITANALWSLLVLGLADERCEKMVKRLLDWQWPSGGWNCDKRPNVQRSSFMETITPLRALARYTKETGDSRTAQAVERAAEVFLKRQLFKRLQDGEIMHPSYVQLHYPCYWHYDILLALKVMSEAGFMDDPRCTAALELLESKRLPDGGFPAEKKYYRVTEQRISGRSLVDWGGTSKRNSNPFVSLDALRVLHAAGRIAADE
jgi:hypothetical protein